MAEPIGSKASMLRCELPGTGHVLFTTRAHGNLSSVGGIDHEQGHDARERLRTQLCLRRLARGYQVHGTTVLRIRADADVAATDIAAPDSTTAQPPVHADGQSTSLAGVGAMVLAADCLPVALGSEDAVAMVHAGWRGLAAGVLEQGVRAVRELGGEGEIAAIIGPGAGPCCYEVGPEVHTAFAYDPSPSPILGGRGTHRRLADRSEGAGTRAPAGGRCGSGARHRLVHDLRRALLLSSARTRARGTPGGSGVAWVNAWPAPSRSRGHGARAEHDDAHVEHEHGAHVSERARASGSAR